VSSVLSQTHATISAEVVAACSCTSNKLCRPDGQAGRLGPWVRRETGSSTEPNPGVHRQLARTTAPQPALPLHALQLAAGLSKHPRVAPVPTDLINTTYAGTVMPGQEAGRKLFSEGFVPPGDGHALALSGSIPSQDTCMCEHTRTRLLPLGMLFQQLNKQGSRGMKRLGCFLLLSFGRLYCPLKST